LSALELACPRETRLVFASSSEVYRDQSGLLGEDAALRTQGEGRWAYAAAKLEGERRVLQANRLARVVRFFNVVGPGQSSAAGMVLPRFVERARAGLPLELYGDGSAQRCYAHVDEVARVLSDLAVHPCWQEPVLNVGGQAHASARALAQCVLRHSGSSSVLMQLDPKRVLGSQFAEVRQRAPDLSRLKRMGIALPARDLDAIVLDMLARHPRVEAQACASLA
jgi:UDP-glucose 4-epimerase